MENTCQHPILYMPILIGPKALVVLYCISEVFNHCPCAEESKGTGFKVNTKGQVVHMHNYAVNWHQTCSNGYAFNSGHQTLIFRVFNTLTKKCVGFPSGGSRRDLPLGFPVTVSALSVLKR